MKLPHRTWLVSGASFGRSAAVPSIRSRSAETEKVTRMSDETFLQLKTFRLTELNRLTVTKNTAAVQVAAVIGRQKHA